MPKKVREELNAINSMTYELFQKRKKHELAGMKILLENGSGKTTIRSRKNVYALLKNEIIMN